MHSWHLFFATLEHSSKQLNRILRTQSDRPSLLHCFYLLLSLSVLSFHCLFSITFTSSYYFPHHGHCPCLCECLFHYHDHFHYHCYCHFQCHYHCFHRYHCFFHFILQCHRPSIVPQFQSLSLRILFSLFLSFLWLLYLFPSLSLQISLLIFLSLHFLFKCLCHSPSSSLSHSSLFSLSLSWPFL